MSKQDNSALVDLVQTLQPKFFAEKYKLYVSEPSWNNTERDFAGEIVSLSSQRAQHFGEESGRSWPDWKQNINLLLEGEQREAQNFAKGLQDTLPANSDLVSDCLAYMTKTTEPTNPTVLGSYIAAHVSKNEKFVDWFIQKLQITPCLYEYAVWLFCQIRIDDNAIKILIEMMAEEKISPLQFGILKYGGVLKGVSSNMMNVLLNLLYKRAETDGKINLVILELIHMFIFQRKQIGLKWVLLFKNLFQPKAC